MNTERIRLERLVRRAKNDEEKCEALCRLAETLSGSAPQRATELAMQALELARQRGYRVTEAYALSILGPIESLCSRDGAGLDHIEQSRRIAMEIDDDEVLARGLVAAAFVRLNNRELDESLRLAEQALEVAREAGDPHAESDSLLMLARVLTQRSEWTRADAVLRRAERKIGSDSDDPRYMKLLLCRGILCARQSKPDESIPTLTQAVELARACDNRVVESHALLALGRVSGSMGDYPIALGHLMTCSQIAEQFGVIRTQLDALLDISILNKLFGKVEQSRTMAERVLDLSRQHGKRSVEAWALHHLAEHAYDLDDLDTALVYQQQCAAICEQANMPDLLGNTREGIGNILRDRKQFDEALEYYALARETAEQIGDQYSMASTDYSIALLHLDRSEFTESIEVFTRSLERAESIQVHPLIRSIHNTLAYVYEQRGSEGDERQALTHLKKSAELKEQLMSAERQRQVADMEARAAIERAEREREKEQARGERLALEAQHHIEELNGLGVHLAERTELINAVNRELRLALECSGSEREQILRTLVKTLEESGQTEQHWSGFQEKLQSIHHGVLIELARWCPDLKPAELKVCALLRTQLSTKEIASLLSVTERAVEKHRYNIRRKLGLSKEENLVAYLARIASPAVVPVASAA